MDKPVTTTNLSTQQSIDKKRKKLAREEKKLLEKLDQLFVSAEGAEPDALKCVDLQQKIVRLQLQTVGKQIKDLGPTPKATTPEGRLLNIITGAEPGTTDQVLKAIAIYMNKEGSEQTDEEPVDWEKVPDDE